MPAALMIETASNSLGYHTDLRLHASLMIYFRLNKEPGRGENYQHPPAHDDPSEHLGALLVEDREVDGGHRG